MTIFIIALVGIMGRNRSLTYITVKLFILASERTKTPEGNIFLSFCYEIEMKQTDEQFKRKFSLNSFTLHAFCETGEYITKRENTEYMLGQLFY
jgi:hypothetical protein